MRFMACILALVAATQMDSCLPRESPAPSPQAWVLASGNLNNLVLVAPAGPGGFRYWLRDARGTWRDGGTGQGDVAAVAAWREDMLVLFASGRYGLFSSTETTVNPSPVPAWKPVAACEDGLAVEAFGWNASGEPVLARYEGGKWAWQRVEAEIPRDKAKDVRLVRHAGRPYIVWREEIEPLLEKGATAPATAFRVRFAYADAGQWHLVTSRLRVTSAPLVASDGEHLVFLYQKPPAPDAAAPGPWTLATYLTSDEDWHDAGPVTGAVPAGPLALACQGTRLFVAGLAEGQPVVAGLDAASNRLDPFVSPVIEKKPDAGNSATESLMLILAISLLAGALLALNWRRARLVAAIESAAPAKLAPGLELASLSRRAIACIIDYVIIIMVVVAPVILLTPELYEKRLALQLLPQDEAMKLVNSIVLDPRIFWPWLFGPIAYFAAFEAIFGRTPGKRLLGLRVISETGGRITVSQALIRNILRLIDNLMAPYVIGLISAMLSPKMQRLGDRVGHTLVVKDVPARAQSTPPRP
jgi:uncharacterized RDD family membrane protein YckC